MNNAELERFVPRLGDVYKIKLFASNYKENKKLLTSEGISNKSCAPIDSTGARPKSYKPRRKINISWKCDNKIVRGWQGGITRQVDALKSLKKTHILEKALAFYFPNGKSFKKGYLADYNVGLLDFARNR